MTVPAPEVLLAFAAASFVIMVIPGPAVIYVVARSVEQGRAAGLFSMLGLETGAGIHVLLSVVGIAALVQASPAAIAVLTWAGAGYLLWLAVRCLRTLRARPTDAEGRAVAPARLFWDGVLVDLLNPKTALFFLAFLPQFADAGRGSVPAQLAVLGLVFVLIAAVCDGTYALLAGRLSTRLRASATAQRRLGIVTAGVYVSLAVAAVTL